MLDGCNGATEEISDGSTYGNEVAVASYENKGAQWAFGKRVKRRQVLPNDLKHHERYFVPESITCSLSGDGVSSLWLNNVGTTHSASASVNCGQFRTTVIVKYNHIYL